MRRVYVFLLAVGVGLSGCGDPEGQWLGESAPDSRPGLDLKGPVTELLEEQSFPGNPIEGNGEVRRRRRWKFDQEGRLIEHRNTEIGQGETVTTYEYNAHGQPLNITVESGPLLPWRSQIAYSYRPDGLVAEEQSFNKEGKCQRRTVYEYDDRHRLVRVVEPVTPDGVPQESRLHYPDSGRSWSVREHFRNGNLDFTEFEGATGVDSVLDALGRLRSRDFYDTHYRPTRSETYSDGILSFWIDMRYDTEGRLARRLEFRADGFLRQWEAYTYDEEGRRIGERQAPVREDFNPYVVADTLLAPQAVISYRFDQEGNWTERTTTVQGAVTGITRRQIQYGAE